MPDDVRARLEDALGDAYTLERELGGGGMSRVFLATEKALGRRVVVKVLSAELGAEVSAERFRREIQLVAQMQHACIVPVLNSGVAGDLPYYAMPFVEGESLRARLTRVGELPVPEAVRILRDVLEALSYAHGRGIVHRDIKPENVLLTRHHALLADFGVAKAVGDAAQARSGGLTGVGLALGTPAYMAPEQAAADPATDHRADIYSVGALAYEMLTGQPVFTARSPQAMLAAHAVERPEPVERRRSNTPPTLAALVMCALEKLPADRPQSADEMLQELERTLTPGGGMTAASAAATSTHAAAAAGEAAPGRRRRSRVTRYAWIGGAAAAGVAIVAAALLLAPADNAPAGPAAPPSIAVLPFANVSGSAQEDYLSDGLSEELIAALSKVPDLQVAARTSSFAYKGRNEDARTIGEKLGVAHILGGSVRRAGNRLRVSAQLTNVQTGYNLWSDTYNREMTDVFALQDEIARAIVGALQVRLGNDRVVHAKTADSEAYELYLRGRYLLNQRGASIVPAREHFERAIARDPDFAAAHAGLAEAFYVASRGWGYMEPAQGIAEAEVAAQNALALDSTLTDAHVVLGSVRCARNERRPADVSFRRAIELDPRSGRAYYFYSLCLSSIGRGRSALDAGRRAVALEPLNPQFAVAVARAYVQLDRPRESLSALEAARRQAPQLSSLYHNAIPALVLLRDERGLEEAALMFGRGFTPTGVALRELTKATAAALRGDTAGAGDLARRYERGPTGAAESVALLYLVLGDSDGAVRAMEIAWAQFIDQWGLASSPLFEPLRGDPGFQAFARRYQIPLESESF